MTDVALNSKAWWNEMFGSAWESNSGREQTRHFMERLIANLPEPELEFLRTVGVSILDWGCALGDGVDVLAHAFPDSKLVGLDFSRIAVEKARLTFPHLEFRTTEEGDIAETVDVITCSNCLEHFDAPLEVMRSQLAKCRQVYVALVPLDEKVLCESHRSRFDENSFPTEVEGFRRLHCQSVEVDDRLWGGKQLLAVYGSPDYCKSRAVRAEQIAERAKWDAYYSQYSVMDDAAIRASNGDLAEQFAQLLPDGGRILEVGCGAGGQSLALARLRRFDISLMDFSKPALQCAEAAFRRENQSAHFIQDDAFALRSPEYDLVFNAGSLEHYSAEGQIAFLRGMASRSRRYVLVLVPNNRCYWYWIWRVRGASRGHWPYGEETPVSDLSGVFRAAGLTFLGDAFLGETWTEDFITALPGMDEQLRQDILAIHRSPVVLSEQKAYLYAALGVVEPALTLPAGTVFHCGVRESVIDDPRGQATQADLLAARQNVQRLEADLLVAATCREDGRRMEEEKQVLQSRLDSLLASRMVRCATAINGTLGRVRNKLGVVGSVGGANLALFLRVIRSQGIRHALVLAKQFVQRKVSKPQTATCSVQDRYTQEQSAQRSYVSDYLEGGMDRAHRDILNSFIAEHLSEGAKVLIYPLSYPLELAQRPDHILRSFAQQGYFCIIISVDDQPPFIHEHSTGVYLTNLFAATIKHFSNKDVCFYITYPFCRYIRQFLSPQAVVLYDVLDDLSVFSLDCDAMRKDHAELLEAADVVIFSSQSLMDTNRKGVRNHSYLVTNGVWAGDFIMGPGDGVLCEIPKQDDEFIIGYHGAISDLLDWELIENIIAVPRVRLVLVGPCLDFAQAPAANNTQARQRVLSSPHVTHIPTVPYKDLKCYLSQFDAAVIPFVISAKTNPVSPLKLFEYMAMGLKVFATPTTTLASYSNYITVADRRELPNKIRNFIDKPSARCCSDYKAVLETVDWGKQLAPVQKEITALLSRRQVKRPKVRQVDIINVNFFDWDGVTLYKGGAERYVHDLSQLLKRMGWAPRIIQNANRPFRLDFKGIPVVGVHTACGHEYRGMSSGFRSTCENADLVIASPLELACGLKGMDVIGINHGIHWDHKQKSLATANMREYRNIFDALKTVRLSVCVDTNFINWVRTYDYRLGEKLKYVPNYFNSSAGFVPVKKDFSGRIRAIFPRRLYEARGCFITLEAFDYLLKKHQDLDLHLVGQANHEDGQVVSEFVRKHVDRVIWEELEMDDMPRAYRTSHVALIPTMYSEGTSLSCLEAMATNNAIVATNVGGLPNLIVHGFNGLLIEPTVSSLIRAVESLLNNRAKMAAMAEAGLRVAPAFEKEKWNCHWQKIINEGVLN